MPQNLRAEARQVWPGLGVRGGGGASLGRVGTENVHLLVWRKVMPVL